MESYVGLDVSLKRTSICVVGRTGKVLCEGTVNSAPEAIVGFVKSKAAGAVRIGLETGPTSTWLWTEIKALGLPVICIDARHAKAVLKMQINKSDRNDAFGIARIMQCGWYKEVRVKGLDSHAMRALLESRALLVKMKRDLENQIRGLLKNLGLIIATARGQAFHARVQELVEPSRFKRSRSVGAYVGLTTRRYASGEVDWTGRISKCGDAMLRSYLFEAAGVLLTRVQKWCALKAWGMRLAKRVGLRKAKVAVARKLAVILHRMWIDGTEFQWSADKVVA